jgi:shikimate kinase
MKQSVKTSKVIVIAGAAASGKSHYAKKLKRKYGLQILDLDDSLAEMIKKEQDKISEIGMENFLAEIRDFRYRDLQARGVKAIEAGQSVALVAPFSRHIQDVNLWKEFCAPFIELGLEPELHWIRVNNSERAARLLRRGAERDMEKIRTSERLQDYLGASDISPPIHPHFEVDGTK